VGNNGFGAGYHMIYAPAAYVVTFARLYSYDDDDDDAVHGGGGAVSGRRMHQMLPSRLLAQLRLTSASY
jgi:hypothetical protein